jgi:D-psicose/D-tagatose/L-ribulose 3-epimerase
MQGLRSDEADTDTANGRIIECLKEVAAAAESKGVEFVLEPVNHLQAGFNTSVAEVLATIEAVDSPAIRPMVDTVHMNIEEKSLTQPIYDCGARLRHVHLCESNGGFFGTGRVDFAAVLQALDNIGYEGFGSVKVYRQATMEEAVRTSIEALERARP